MGMKKANRVLAVVTTLAFICTNTALAAPANVWERQGKDNITPIAPLKTVVRYQRPLDQAWDPIGKLPASIDQIKVSAAYGKVTDIAKGMTGKPVIFHIQDLHTHVQAHTNAAQLMDELVRSYGSNLILYEGGSSDVDYGYLRELVPLETRQERAKELMDKGILTCDSYIDIATDLPLDFQGIEDKNLYDANMQAFYKVESFKADLDAYLSNVNYIADQLKSSIFNKDLLAFDQKKKDYYDEKIDIVAYVDFLRKQSVIASERGERSNLKKFEEAIAIEKKLNFAALTTEREALLDAILKNASEADKKEVQAKADQFRDGDITQKQFNDALIAARDKLKLTDPVHKDFPGIVLYNQYLAIFEQIDTDKLHDEIADLEQALTDDLAKTADEKQLARISYDMDILNKLLSLRLTPKEYDYFLQNKARFEDIDGWVSFIKENAGKYNIAAALEAYNGDVKDNIAVLAGFYQAAIDRDGAFVKNSERAIGTHQAAILFAGGFHTPHIKKLFSEKGYTFITIAPKITEPFDEELYHRILKGRYDGSYWDNLRKGNTDTLAPENEKTDDPKKRQGMWWISAQVAGRDVNRPVYLNMVTEADEAEFRKDLRVAINKEAVALEDVNLSASAIELLRATGLSFILPLKTIKIVDPRGANVFGINGIVNVRTPLGISPHINFKGKLIAAFREGASYAVVTEQDAKLLSDKIQYNSETLSALAKLLHESVEALGIKGADTFAAHIAAQKEVAKLAVTFFDARYGNNIDLGRKLAQAVTVDHTAAALMQAFYDKELGTPDEVISIDVRTFARAQDVAPAVVIDAVSLLNRRGIPVSLQSSDSILTLAHDHLSSARLGAHADIAGPGDEVAQKIQAVLPALANLIAQHTPGNQQTEVDLVNLEAGLNATPAVSAAIANVASQSRAVIVSNKQTEGLQQRVIERLGARGIQYQVVDGIQAAAGAAKALRDQGAYVVVIDLLNEPGTDPVRQQIIALGAIIVTGVRDSVDAILRVLEWTYKNV